MVITGLTIRTTKFPKPLNRVREVKRLLRSQVRGIGEAITKVIDLVSTFGSLTPNLEAKIPANNSAHCLPSVILTAKF